MAATRSGRRIAIGGFLIALTAGLAACQPLPQPFAHSATDPALTNALLTVEDAGGVVVLPVTAAPDALQRAIIDALQEANVPASDGSSNSRSRYLSGHATAEPAGDGLLTLRIEWDLLSADGTVLAAYAQVQTQPGEPWHQGHPDLMQRLAQDVVGALDSALRPAEPSPPVVHDVWVASSLNGNDGGDGGAALTLALRAAIAGADPDVAGLRLAAGPLQAQLVIVPKVSIVRQADGDLVAIDWVVTHATQELGRITQANSVPHGQLPAGWPAIAPLIVQAVIDGLSDLARRVAASKS